MKMRNLSFTKILYKNLPYLLLSLILTLGTFVSEASPVRVKNENDSLRILEVMDQAAEAGGDFGERCVTVAKLLQGVRLGKAADNDSIGTMAIDMKAMDHLGFINTVMALAEASMSKTPDFNEFAKYLERYGRKKGVDSGFTSQFFYGADWIVDNVYRGNLKEMTEYLTGGGFKTKTLDYVSHHPEEYPALKDSVTMEKIKMMEMGYRSHRVPHLKKQSIGNRPLHELMAQGDIIMMLNQEIDRDIYDMGFVELREGVPYMIHFSSETGEVVADPYPAQRLFKLENQHFYGYRWLRPKDD